MENTEGIFPWDRFREWIHCIAVVTFDLELGQTLELVHPSPSKLSEEEKTNICYLSFPDSNSGCMGDTQFFFRIRHTPTKFDKLSSEMINSYNSRCVSPLRIHNNFMFGYVYFRQVKDPSLRRGYFQKSVVVLTKLPFVNLFVKVLEILAPHYFEHGVPSIEAAIHDFYQWSWPNPGDLLHLPFLGTVFQLKIPSASCGRLLLSNGESSSHQGAEASNSTLTNIIPNVIAPGGLHTLCPIGSVFEADLFRCLRPVLSHIHLLWELVLTSEPIVVMSPLPFQVSATVHALISMIYPLKYCADFRPYFTIHDSDFKEYTMKALAPPSVILGVTNPFFAKTLQHWPHIIRMGDSTSDSYSEKLKKANNMKLLDSQPGVYTSYKSFIHKDKDLLKKILMGMQSQRPETVQTVILRKHLQELTESFMIPLERYIASLMPLHKIISPCKAPPLPRPFNPDDFLSTLETSGPHLTTGVKGDWAGLYKKFFRSINFSDWYNMRYKEAAEKLQVLHLEVISNTDVDEWITGRDEVEAVDLILKLREQISQTHLPMKPQLREKLKGHVESILNTLPDDLQTVLKPN